MCHGAVFKWSTARTAGDFLVSSVVKRVISRSPRCWGRCKRTMESRASNPTALFLPAEPPSMGRRPRDCTRLQRGQRGEGFAGLTVRQVELSTCVPAHVSHGRVHCCRDSSMISYDGMSFEASMWPCPKRANHHQQ